MKGEIEKKVIKIKQVFSFLEQYSYEFEGTTEINEIYVTLSNPKLHSGNQVLFTPAFAEIGIYVVSESAAPNISWFVNATVIPFKGANSKTDSARLVDKDYEILFTFHKWAFSTLNDKEVLVVLDLGKEDYDVNSFEKAISITDTFNYTYSIYTQKTGDENWQNKLITLKQQDLQGIILKHTL